MAALIPRTSDLPRLRTRLLAEWMYFWRGLRVLVRPLLGLVVVYVLGAWVLHTWGAPRSGPGPSWSEAFFTSYTLLFWEHVEAFPPHPIAQAVHYVQPVVGILLIGEGIVSLGLNVFRKEQNALAWTSIMAKATKGHVVVCGLGNVGFRVIEHLTSLDVPVFAVEKDPNGDFLERARGLGAQVLVGDARSDEILSALNLAAARAIIVATDDDLANLEIAMDVRELHAELPLVMRLFDQRLAQKVKHSLGVNTSVSTSKVAAPLLAGAALDPCVVGTHRIGDEQLVMLELEVGPGLAQTPAALKERGITVLAHRGAGGAPWTLHVPSDQPLSAGTQVQAMVERSRIAEVHALNGRG